MRVALLDDHVLLREGLARLLIEAGMDVTASLGEAEAFLAEVASSRPDVAVVDIRLPPSFSDEGLRVADELRARHPEMGVLVLSQYLEVAYAMRLLERFPGGIGYLLKDRVSHVAVLVDTLQRIAAGECVVDPSIAAQLFGRPSLVGSLASLTGRERDVLALMAEGRSNRTIGQRLFLSEKTVEGHVRRIFEKLRLEESIEDNRRVLAVIAFLRA